VGERVEEGGSRHGLPRWEEAPAVFATAGRALNPGGD
jgi:hypothetical protein